MNYSNYSSYIIISRYIVKQEHVLCQVNNNNINICENYSIISWKVYVGHNVGNQKTFKNGNTIQTNLKVIHMETSIHVQVHKCTQVHVVLITYRITLLLIIIL